MQNNLLASVVIPVYNRQREAERAIDSILTQRNSYRVQLVVVDDFSDTPFEYDKLRSFDKVIRLDENRGGGFSRALGIKEASADVIYFLDSDDYFVERDFILDNSFVLGSSDLFFCDIKTKSGTTCFPEVVNKENYLISILCKHEGLGQTSSLVFDRRTGATFDSTLRKHQDWDFVISNFIVNNANLVKIPGYIYLDRGDRKSVSRVSNPKISMPWLNKLSSYLDPESYQLVYFHVLCRYREKYNWFSFFKKSILYIFNSKMTFPQFLKRIGQRIFH